MFALYLQMHPAIPKKTAERKSLSAAKHGLFHLIDFSDLHNQNVVYHLNASGIGIGGHFLHPGI